MTYRSLEGMIRDVISEGLIQEASLGDSKGLMALARRRTGDEKDVMNRAADMMKKGQIKDLNMFMKAMDKSTHKAIMPFIDKKYNKALHEDLEEAVEMCSEECCGLPVTECTCAPDCEHCDCNKINEAKTGAEKNRAQFRADKAKLHKVLGPTKNMDQGLAAIKKAFKVSDAEAKEMIMKLINEEAQKPVSQMTPAEKAAHDARRKEYNEYQKSKRNEQSDQTDRLSSPLKKDRLDKERQDRDKDGKLKATALPRKKVTEEQLDEIIPAIAGIARGAATLGAKAAGGIAKAGAKVGAAAAKKVGAAAVQGQQDEARGYGEADTHIIMQLRSAQDLGGKKDITFRGGAKAQVDKKHIDKILKLHDHPALKPVQKRQMRVAISKSPKHLASFASKLKEDYDADNVDSILNEAYEEKQDITQQMADKAKKDHMASSDKNKLKKLSDMMKKANEEGFANPAQQAAVMSKLKASGKYKKEEADLDETKGAPKGYHFTRSGQLKKGDANQDGDGGAMLRSDPLDKQRKKIPALPESDEGAPQVSTPRADYKLGKVRMPDGKMVYRKVKKQVDIEK